MLRALLIDDELNNLESLNFFLENDCSGIEVLGKLTSAQEAREFLVQNEVDVIFLDINMPGENGFEFLRSLGNHQYNIIFVTAYNEYALQAIKENALDYILKPIDIEELQRAISKLKKIIDKNVTKDQEILNLFLEKIKKNTFSKRIAIPQLGSICYIEIDNIVSLQADSNYTIIHMNTMQKLVFSKTLKEFEEMLDPKQFARIHKSYIVNLQHVKEYKSVDGGIVKMSDGNHWSVSRRQLDNFLEKMK